MPGPTKPRAMAPAPRRQRRNLMAIIVFLLFVVFVVGLSLYLGNKAKTSSGYYAAGGKIHWGVNGIAFAPGVVNTALIRALGPSSSFPGCASHAGGFSSGRRYVRVAGSYRLAFFSRSDRSTFHTISCTP